VTGRQGMLTFPWHLILTLAFSEVRVIPIFTVDNSMYLILALILTADFPVYLIGLTVLDCGLLHSPNLDTLILTTDI
jgi:hypothetical protein